MAAVKRLFAAALAAWLLAACAAGRPPGAQDAVPAAFTRKADAVVASLGYAEIPGRLGAIGYAGGYEHALVMPAPTVRGVAPALAGGRATVHFEFGSAALSGAEKEKLSGFLERLGVADIESVLVEGHTDADGPDAYNLRLSGSRAAGVSAFLQALGVPGGRIDAAGFGESTPVESNDTESGRAANRRADVKPMKAGN
jgi:hypothetical protein